MKQNFNTIRQEGRLLYEYIRGSHLYGLATDSSDIDTSGVYICKPEHFLGFLDYEPQLTDSRHDNTWYEMGELIRLLCKSNPTVLESLFVPDDMIIGNVHPIMRMLIDNRDQFVSKMCFNPFFGYAKSQIEKARGLNKKICNPVTERLTPYDFIYTFSRQGSTKLKNWLQSRGLLQMFCGLVNVPHMHDIYGVYYDFGAHVNKMEGWSNDERFITFASEFLGIDRVEVVGRLGALSQKGYKGIMDADGMSNDIRLSSVEDENEMPVCFMQYNQSGYTEHCRQYNDYMEWERNRNPIRYESNIEHNYDSKNMMHCFRLIHMAKEIARGEGVILRRTWDHDFLMDVRNHKFEYDFLMERLEDEKEEMNKLMQFSTIREKVDVGFANNLLIEIRRNVLNSWL